MSIRSFSELRDLFSSQSTGLWERLGYVRESICSHAARLWHFVRRYVVMADGDQGWTVLDTVMSFIGVAIGIVAGYAVGFWLLAYLPDPSHPFVGGSIFTLAQVMAIFGAFGFAAGFSNYGRRGLRNQLRRAGALHIMSALGFSLLGMIFPISTNEAIWAEHGRVLGTLNTVALVMAIVGFGVGTTLWVSQFHKLLGFREARDGSPESSPRSEED